MSINNVTYIITAEQRDHYLDCIADCEISGLEGMFETPLSEDGSLPATHFISSGFLSDEQVQWLDERFTEEDGTIKLDAGFISSALSDSNLTIVVPEENNESVV